MSCIPLTTKQRAIMYTRKFLNIDQTFLFLFRPIVAHSVTCAKERRKKCAYYKWHVCPSVHLKVQTEEIVMKFISFTITLLHITVLFAI